MRHLSQYSTFLGHQSVVKECLQKLLLKPHIPCTPTVKIQLHVTPISSSCLEEPKFARRSMRMQAVVRCVLFRRAPSMLHLELAQIKCIPATSYHRPEEEYLGFSSRSKGGGSVGEPGTSESDSPGKSAMCLSAQLSYWICDIPSWPKREPT